MKTRNIGKGLAALRVTLGAAFLFAGLEKVLHFDGATKPFDAAGFLKFATTGALPGSDPKAIVNPTHDFWVALAGNAQLMSVVNTLVVFGEVAIGLALVLGIATRFAGVAATLMMALFWVANFSFANGPFNEQFLYAIVAAFLAYAGAGEAYGLDAIIEKTETVRRAPALRYVLG
ncbi:MAG TPA: DoxX family protein [Candidatus Limnocylindrales bacterium]